MIFMHSNESAYRTLSERFDEKFSEIVNLKFECFERCLISFKNFAKIQMVGPKMEIRPTFVWLNSYFSWYQQKVELFAPLISFHFDKTPPIYCKKKSWAKSMLLSGIQCIIYLPRSSFKSGRDRILNLLKFLDLVRRTNCSGLSFVTGLWNVSELKSA